MNDAFFGPYPSKLLFTSQTFPEFPEIFENLKNLNFKIFRLLIWGLAASILWKWASIRKNGWFDTKTALGSFWHKNNLKSFCHEILKGYFDKKYSSHKNKKCLLGHILKRPNKILSKTICGHFDTKSILRYFDSKKFKIFSIQNKL